MAAEVVTYAYDALDRLTGATGFLDGSEAHYDYDKIGNLIRKKEGQLDLKLEYPYVGNNPTNRIDPTGLCFTFYENECECTDESAEDWVSCALATCEGVWRDIARWDDEWIARDPLGFFKVWAHEMEHIAQFEDWGDAFWAIWGVEGAWLVFENCVLSPGCNINDVWREQWLERSAEEHSLSRRVFLVVLSAWALSIGVGCDRYARVEVNNNSTALVVVTVNGTRSIEVSPGERVYTGPGVNERLQTLEVQLMASEITETEGFELDTYDDDIVLHITGPPLQVELTHEDHPSSR